jgi:hypothetical protein
VKAQYGSGDFGSIPFVTKTILTDILIMCIWIPLSTGMLAVSPIGNIQHFTVMLKQGYIQNHGAAVMHPRLSQQILVSRVGHHPPINTDANRNISLCLCVKGRCCGRRVGIAHQNNAEASINISSCLCVKGGQCPPYMATGLKQVSSQRTQYAVG